jgi:hypothetical protein
MALKNTTAGSACLGLGNMEHRGPRGRQGGSVCVSQLPAPPTPTISLEMEQRNLPPSHPVLPALRSGLLIGALCEVREHTLCARRLTMVLHAKEWRIPRHGDSK